MSNRLKLGILIVFGLVSAPHMVAARTEPANEIAPVLEQVRQRICSNYVPMSEDYPYADSMNANVRFSLLSGKINQVKLNLVKKDPETAFSVLEAIYASNPLPPAQVYAYSPEGRVRVQETDITLSGKSFGGLRPAKPQDGGLLTPVEKYHPRKKLDIHLIPIDVLNRYPGLFSRAEVLGSENILALPTGALILYPDNFHPVPSKRLMDFFNSWEAFFLAHPKSATRGEVLKARARATAALTAR